MRNCHYANVWNVGLCACQLSIIVLRDVAKTKHFLVIGFICIV